VDRTLIVLRHAKSDWSGGEPDIDRPLAPRGLRQAPEAGQWLAAHAGRLDLALVSPAQRTRSTWELVAAQLTDPPEVRVDDRLYAASGGQLLAVLRELPDDLATIVLVGHNPGVEDLVERLTGRLVELPTSAIAVATGWDSWAGAGDDPAVLRASGRPPR
jgi:phosphohistidine phosphatase